ncbi:MAG TPA: histone deacetylase family protein [Devosia sp.]|jgi:acetoin utilization deacetylase AcuC-like enzyme|nr:histone deacetylase family protein [Devosia sp.]
MATLLVSQRNFDHHRTPTGHPERADRIRAVDEVLAPAHFPELIRRDAPSGDLTLADLVHAPGYLQALAQTRPAEGIAQIDEDTFICSDSLDAVGTALGAGLAALEAVVLGEVENAFCAVRPPGHHAEREQPMGFCLINTVAIVAREAQRKFGAERVAVVDFDVHHGNGTQDIFFDDPTVMYASTHQMPLFPGTGAANETGVSNNIVNVPLSARSGTAEMRAAYEETILPALLAFRPDFLLLSAGFDADYRDPLAQLNWRPEDFTWLTLKLREVADTCCAGRIVSTLEGGYDRDGLADGVAAHVTALMS